MIADHQIDVWDAETFDGELRGDLETHAGVIRDYFHTSKQLWLEREASDHVMPYPENPHASEFIWVNEHIMRLMERRSIRAWHYTRMTDGEVGILLSKGIRPSTLGTIEVRIRAHVKAGSFSETVGNRLFSDTPFRGEQLESRSNKFWMVSHPLAVDDGGVEDLLRYWGGESVYFRQRNPDLQMLLEGLGRSRVIEIAMPLAQSQHCFPAAEAVVATFGRTLGCEPDKKLFDLYTVAPLGPPHILAVHSHGEPAFMALGRGYPTTFVDVSIGDLDGA